MNESFNVQQHTQENVIIANAKYVDNTTFMAIVNFERMLSRRISKANFAQWVDCIALDGGIRPGNNSTQVILLHPESKKEMDNFEPSNFAKDLDGKAFSDNLGEFSISCVSAKGMVSEEEFFAEAISITAKNEKVKRLMIIPDAELELQLTLQALKNKHKDLQTTIFTMQPEHTSDNKQELLVYSIMKALGINADEIK